MSPFHPQNEISWGEPRTAAEGPGAARAGPPPTLVTQPMQKHTAKIFLFVLTATAACAQYTPPSPATPVPGMIDDFVISSDPSLKGWDFGVNERLRYEDKSSAGTTHAGNNFDFSSNSPTTNSNDYWLSRLLPRIVYINCVINLICFV